MAVNSLYFPVFLAVLVIIYYGLCPMKYRWVILLAGSAVFYFLACQASPVYVLLSAVVTWGAGLLMERAGKDKKRKKRILAAAAAFNIGILVVLKYGGFFVGAGNGLLSLLAKVLPIPELMLPVPRFAVPLGISYYTLITVGYLMDINKGKVKAQKNPARYFLFLIFFPQITQGPFSRYSQLGPQLWEGHGFSYRNLSFGCQRMLWGCFKKMVIADRMQPMVKEIFGNYQNYGGITCALGCIYMSIQIYADFSGYMDIAAGAAELFGIHIAENFRRPFFACSLEEFWRRWHITLGGWFRDYMFYPIALSPKAVKLGRKGRKWFGMRVGKLMPSLFGLVFVWFFTGFWHDASLNYILWGVANGVVITGSMLLEPWFGKAKRALHIDGGSRLWHFFCVFRTFLLVSALKIFPGSASAADVWGITKTFLRNFRLPSGRAEWFPGMRIGDIGILFLSLLLLLAVDLLQEREPVREFLAKRSFAVRWVCYGVLIAVILCMGQFNTGAAGGFAYAQY